MREILFDGRHKVTKEDVIEKMNYFINSSRHGMIVFEKDKEACFKIAKSIREELEKEYKNNSLKRINNIYRDNEWFNYYEPAVHDAIASISGRMTYSNMDSFLYDVEYYMNYYLPKIDS